MVLESLLTIETFFMIFCIATILFSQNKSYHYLIFLQRSIINFMEVGDLG
jgi:hypothetical protein